MGCTRRRSRRLASLLLIPNTHLQNPQSLVSWAAPAGSPGARHPGPGARCAAPHSSAASPAHWALQVSNKHGMPQVEAIHAGHCRCLMHTVHRSMDQVHGKPLPCAHSLLDFSPHLQAGQRLQQRGHEGGQVRADALSARRGHDLGHGCQRQALHLGHLARHACRTPPLPHDPAPRL